MMEIPRPAALVAYTSPIQADIPDYAPSIPAEKQQVAALLAIQQSDRSAGLLPDESSGRTTPPSLTKTRIDETNLKYGRI